MILFVINFVFYWKRKWRRWKTAWALSRGLASDRQGWRSFVAALYASWRDDKWWRWWWWWTFVLQVMTKIMCWTHEITFSVVFMCALLWKGIFDENPSVSLLVTSKHVYGTLFMVRKQLRQKLPSAAKLNNRFKCKTRLDTTRPWTQLLETNIHLMDVVLAEQKCQAYSTRNEKYVCYRHDQVKYFTVFRRFHSSISFKFVGVRRQDARRSLCRLLMHTHAEF